MDLTVTKVKKKKAASPRTLNTVWVITWSSLMVQINYFVIWSNGLLFQLSMTLW